MAGRTLSRRTWQFLPDTRHGGDVATEKKKASFAQRMYLAELRVRLGDSWTGLHTITADEASEEIVFARRRLADKRGLHAERLLDPDFEELTKIT
jgi:hypothetical protein